MNGGADRGVGWLGAFALLVAISVGIGMLGFAATVFEDRQPCIQGVTADDCSNPRILLIISGAVGVPSALGLGLAIYFRSSNQPTRRSLGRPGRTSSRHQTVEGLRMASGHVRAKRRWPGDPKP